MSDDFELATPAGPSEAARVALACARLGASERELLERVLARGGRATLEEAAADPAAIARLERALGWFGFDPEGPRAGPQARVRVAPGLEEHVASSVAGVPPLRRRPVRAFTLEARVRSLPPGNRAAALAGLAGEPLASGAAALESAEPLALATALARADRVRARAASLGARTLALVEELVRRGGLAPLVTLPRELRETALAPESPLERGFLGEVGRLERPGLGVALDRPFALLAREVHEALALDAAPKPERAPARPLLAGGLLAVDPALALAREGELREVRARRPGPRRTADLVLAQRSRERLAAALVPGPRLLGRPEDDASLLARVLVGAGVLEAREDGLLSPGPGALVFARGTLREQLELLLAGSLEAVPAPGGSWPQAAIQLARALHDELLDLAGPVPAELPARLALFRWLERATAGPEPAPEAEALELEDLVALAWTIAVPAAEALGIVAVEAGPEGGTRRLWPTELQPVLRGAAGTDERCAILSADGEAVVLPLASAPRAALRLARVAERVGAGEVLRFRLTASSVRGAQARADELEALLAGLRALARGDVPEPFERLVRDASGGAVRARESVLRVLEIPRVAAADRAVRVLGDLVLDRLTPTLLVLREALTPAQRRALAREGVYVDP